MLPIYKQSVMAKVKELLFAYFTGQVFKGNDFKTICIDVLEGQIKANKTYIQAFKKETFWGIEPDVVFLTTRYEKCYLWEINS